MKSGSRFLQVTAFFPLALALLVSLSFVVRVKLEDEVNRRVAASDKILQYMNRLTGQTLSYLYRPSPLARAKWAQSYGQLGVILADLPREESAVRGLPDPVRLSYAKLNSLFSRLARMAGAGQPGKGPSAELLMGLAEWQRYSETILSGSYHYAFAAQLRARSIREQTDAIMIIFSSLLALVLAFGAFLAIRQELQTRRGDEEALRRSDMLLSDAFLKLRRASQQVFHQERLHALEQVASSVVHECKNALVPLMAGSFVLKDLASIRDPEQLAKKTKMIETAGRTAHEAVDRLTRFLRAAPSSPDDRSDLNEVVQDAIHLLRDKWRDRLPGKELRIDTDLGSVPALHCKNTDLSEVVTELLKNSIEATGGGGQIMLRTRSAKNWIALEVSDTGCGMTPDVQQRCLEPFFSTKGAGFTGMGLTVAHGILKQYHGTLDIESAPRKGTTVVACLPMEGPDTARQSAGVDMADYPCGLRILVIDDEPWSRAMLVHGLVPDRHRVEIATNGTEGLEKFQMGPYDVVLTDRAMPDMGGKEVARSIKALKPDQPIILVSGFTEDLGKEPQDVSGMNAIISKPIDLEDLRVAIAKVMAGRQRCA
jgi:signal transduction histidine kinase/CheY-like chemotaxis protein